MKDRKGKATRHRAKRRARRAAKYIDAERAERSRRNRDDDARRQRMRELDEQSPLKPRVVLPRGVKL